MALELYNGKYCISGTELIISEENPEGLVSKPMYDKMRRKNPDIIARRGCFETPSLIIADLLPTKYRVMVEKRYPNARAQADAKQYFEKIGNDPEAVDFYASFQLQDGSHLPENTQTEYVNNARLLNMFRQELLECRIAKARNSKNVNKSGFWTNMSENLKRFADICPNSLPENPRRLREKYDEYIRDGYRSLVSGRFLNQNTTKITDEVGDWLIARFASVIDRVTISQLWSEYNRIAPDKGWKEIKSDRSIRIYLESPKIKPLWYGARYGELSSKEKFSRQHRTLLPTMRDSLWYSDGTKLNYFYRNDNGKIETCNVYEVIDVYSEVLLGYHISKSEDYEAQFHAFKMAMQTAGHKPYEIVFDNQGGHNKLKTGEFFNNLSKIARNTAPYNGKSKTIENAFKRFQESCLHRDPFFTGQNITTNKTESRANMEWILANAKNLPTLEEIKQYYKQRRNEWNNSDHPKTGRPRMEMYRSSFNPNSRPIDILDMVNLFWIRNEKACTYRASGIQITVKGISYAYEVLTQDNEPDDAFRMQNVGQKFIIKYDPDDMDVIALYEDTASGLRFRNFARTYLYVHRSKQEQEHGEAAFIKAREIAAKAERMENQLQLENRLERHGLHPEQHGYTMPTPKGISKKDQERYDMGTYTKQLSNALPQELINEADEVLEDVNVAALY